MQLQQTRNIQDFQGKVFVHQNLNKKQKQLVSTVRPYLNKIISNKPYNLYFSDNLGRLEAGASKKAKQDYYGYEYKIPNSISRFKTADQDLLINKSKLVMQSYEKKAASGKYETTGEKIMKILNKIGERLYKFFTK